MKQKLHIQWFLSVLNPVGFLTNQKFALQISKFMLRIFQTN